MSVRIAPARPEDCATVFALVRALAEYERLSHLVVGSEDDLRGELFGVHPVIESVLAWDGDTAVGFALFFHNFSTFLARRGLYLEDLFVVPQARGRGIGKALITHCARVAVTRGCGRFEWSVLDWNESAIAFYRSLGAELLPDWRICRLAGDSLQRFGDAAAASHVPTP
jgi:hypothetical protein